MTEIRTYSKVSESSLLYQERKKQDYGFTSHTVFGEDSLDGLEFYETLGDESEKGRFLKELREDLANGLMSPHLRHHFYTFMLGGTPIAKKELQLH